MGDRAIEVKKAMFFFILVTLYRHTGAAKTAADLLFSPPGGNIRHNAPLSQDGRVSGRCDSEPVDRKTHEAKTSGHSATPARCLIAKDISPQHRADC